MLRTCHELIELACVMSMRPGVTGGFLRAWREVPREVVVDGTNKRPSEELMKSFHQQHFTKLLNKHSDGANTAVVKAVEGYEMLRSAFQLGGTHEDESRKFHEDESRKFCQRRMKRLALIARRRYDTIDTEKGQEGGSDNDLSRTLTCAIFGLLRVLVHIFDAKLLCEIMQPIAHKIFPSNETHEGDAEAKKLMKEMVKVLCGTEENVELHVGDYLEGVGCLLHPGFDESLQDLVDKLGEKFWEPDVLELFSRKAWGAGQRATGGDSGSTFKEIIKRLLKDEKAESIELFKGKLWDLIDPLNDSMGEASAAHGLSEEALRTHIAHCIVATLEYHHAQLELAQNEDQTQQPSSETDQKSRRWKVNITSARVPMIITHVHGARPPCFRAKPVS